MRYKITKEQLEQAVRNNLSIAGVCRDLEIRPVGGNYKTLKAKFKEFNIDISHFTGQGWNQGKRFKKLKKNIPLDEILVENSSYLSTTSLKKRIIKEGLKIHKCEICNITNWNDKVITLELDHVNGNNTDNRIENLRILCPNCHSQTSTFRGKTKLSNISEKKAIEYHKFRKSLSDNTDCNFDKSSNNIEKSEGLNNKLRITKQENNCRICSKSTFNNKFCSVECYREYTSSNRPSVFELLETFDLYNGNFEQVGKHYNISGNGVKKWCITYKILDMIKRKPR